MITREEFINLGLTGQAYPVWKVLGGKLNIVIVRTLANPYALFSLFLRATDEDANRYPGTFMGDFYTKAEAEQVILTLRLSR